MHILIIDDDQDLLEKLSQILQKEHYTIDTAIDGEEGLDKLLGDSYDLVLLDIMLPFKNGLDILKEMRETGLITPVLMLTAKSDIEDKVTGLDLGADDYLAKPFSTTELIARIRALLRRHKGVTPLMKVGHISLDSVHRQVFNDGKKLSLTSKEFAILEFLLHNENRVVSKFSLAEHVWGDNFDSFNMSNFIEVHIKNLRKKLRKKGNPDLIVTVRGYGYRLEDSTH